MVPYSYAWREMRRRKHRTIINIIGYVIIVATLVAIVTTARGWEATTAQPLKQIGTDLIFLYSAPVVPSGSGCYIVNHLFSFPFEQSKVHDIESFEGVERAVPILMHRMGAIVLVGIDPSETETNAVLPENVLDGRFLASEDKNVALVDLEYAQLNNLTLGSTVGYMKGRFEVVGLVDVDAGNILKSHIYVNLPVGQRTIPDNNTGLVNVALLSVNDPREIEEISNALTEQFTGSTVIAAKDLAAKTSNALAIGEETAWNISIALAVVTVLFTVRSQIAAVSERKREIGIFKAIGWSRSNVVSQIFIESAFQGIIGGLVGCVIGVGFAWFFLSGISGGTFVDPVILVIGFAAAVASGMLAGAYPAWKAAKLSPTEALRAI